MSAMRQTRRDFLAGATATTFAGVTLSRSARMALAAAERGGLQVGMCDWSMGHIDVSAFEWGRRIGLDGVEVGIGFAKDNLKLRQTELQQKYLDASRKHGMAIPSVAMGVLNRVPLMSEPRAALWVADTIEVARKLGADKLLLAFFGTGELREENDVDMQRVIDVLRELAPRAEKAGVILGLETYLTAEAHLKIIDAVGSRMVRVYYDVYNADHKGHDVVKEIKLLGGKHICQVHFKEGQHLLGSGKIDWPAVVAALKDVGYAGWAVLETSSPNDLVTDTKKNLAYVKRLFGAAN